MKKIPGTTASVVCLGISACGCFRPQLMFISCGKLSTAPGKSGTTRSRQERATLDRSGCSLARDVRTGGRAVLTARPLDRGEIVLSTIYTFDALYLIPPSTCGIYCIRCSLNGKGYIGSSSNIQRRMRAHKYNAGSNNHGVPLLYDDMRLYGLRFFTVEILELCSQRDLLARENYWIEALATRVAGYNSNFKTDLTGTKRGENSFLIHLEAYNLFGYVIHKIPRHICGVYCITSLDTGKQYVGCSVDLQARLKQHKYDCIKNPEKLRTLY